MELMAHDSPDVKFQSLITVSHLEDGRVWAIASDPSSLLSKQVQRLMSQAWSTPS